MLITLEQSRSEPQTNQDWERSCDCHGNVKAWPQTWGLEGSVCSHSIQFVFRSHIFRQVTIATDILWLWYQPKLGKTAICLNDKPYIWETFDIQHPKSYDQLAAQTPKAVFTSLYTSKG